MFVTLFVHKRFTAQTSHSLQLGSSGVLWARRCEKARRGVLGVPHVVLQ